jgi:hypothetical protein
MNNNVIEPIAKCAADCLLVPCKVIHESLSGGSTIANCVIGIYGGGGAHRAIPRSALVGGGVLVLKDWVYVIGYYISVIGRIGKLGIHTRFTEWQHPLEICIHR